MVNVVRYHNQYNMYTEEDTIRILKRTPFNELFIIWAGKQFVSQFPNLKKLYRDVDHFKTRMTDSEELIPSQNRKILDNGWTLEEFYEALWNKF